MDLIRSSIEKPVTVVVCVVLIVMFGLIGLKRLPYQLSPTVVEPEITVKTTWRGATPYEVEREIVERQEDTLKGIPGLMEMESDSLNGTGTITLRFAVGTDVDDALLRVSNKLGEVPSYPEGVDRPTINATGAATSPVIWMVLKTTEGNETPVDSYKTFFEDEVRQHLERVPGVADLFMGGGRAREMHIIVDPSRLAAHGMTISEVIAAIQSENVNVSAGNVGVGRRDYRIRTTGEFTSPEDIRRVVIRSTGQRRVLLGDVAAVSEGFEKKTSVVLHNGSPGMAVGIKPEPGTNILELTRRIEEQVTWLNENKLRPRGITLYWVYDQRAYINGAIDLIRENILVGGALAVIVLLLFLRSARSTFLVAAAIPVSVIGTFMVLDMMGRNLNVVSLAGIAFSVGMLVDNAIVVIENIDRHRGMGKGAFAAAYGGAREVWGAVLASTLTTVAVFLPVAFVKEEAGQLFRDISIAMVASVLISLFVSVSVIPAFAYRLLGRTKRAHPLGEAVGRFGERLAGAIMGIVAFALRSRATRLGTVALLVALSAGAVAAFLPKLEYLPQGNRNFVLSLFVPPPGLSVEERQEIGERLFETVGPYIGKDTHEGLPGIRNTFFVAHESIMLTGAMSTQDERAAELIPLFRKAIASEPGMFGVSMQAGIFQTSLGRGRTIDVDVSGDDLGGLIRATGTVFGKIKAVMPEAQIRPVPSIELQYPEVRIVPDRDRLRANGMTSRDLGAALDVLLDGRRVGDFKAEGEKTVDLILMALPEAAATPEALYSSTLAAPGGALLPVSSLAALVRTSGITQIRHLERARTFTLQVSPPESVPLQAAMETIEADVFGPLGKEGALAGIDVRMSGVADKLMQTRDVLVWNFVLAAFICYLLMSALFGSFLYPLIILFSVPLAGAGGFIGLRLLNLAGVNQPMDILTMLGFIILIGVVVNNAILIVHQSLGNVRDHGMEPRAAVLEATRTRLRPIYMSAATSIFGLIPLVIFPGAGSELYRGLGSVLLGGLAISTVFTVFLIPVLLLPVIGREARGESGKDGHDE
jgi:HAE1 family hydrophobic/amphiphilic exporter-1